MPTQPCDRRTPLPHTLLLLALTLPAYLLGLNTYGPANWQEAQRIVVAQDMQRTGSWLVPTINCQPYLAKPPLIYWATLGVSELRGVSVSLTDLRIVVALAGSLGVVATYFCALILLRDRSAHPLSAPARRNVSTNQWAQTAAILSALFLAGGILHFRSSRIGELDILLVPFCTIAIAAIAWLYPPSQREGVRGWVRSPLELAFGLALATLAATAAALTKGPPALLIIALGGYGGLLLAATADCPQLRVSIIPRVFAALIGLAAAATALIRRDSTEPLIPALIGCVLISLIAATLALLLARLLRPGAPKAAWHALSRTHPVLVLGVPLGALWLWGWLVRSRIGANATGMAADEAEDNLRLLVAESPLNNLEAAAYGVGLGSILAIVCVVWLLKDRPRIRPGWLIILAWAGLTIAAMSLLGKGVGRYLTPAWPAIAIMGGMFAATLIADAKRPRMVSTAFATLAVALICVQAWWYGFGRETYKSQQTPRPLIAELRQRTALDRLTTINFRTPALDYEVGRWVQPVGEIGMRDSIAGGKPWTMDELITDIKANGSRVLLVRRDDRLLTKPGALPHALSPLDRPDLELEFVGLGRVFFISGYKSPVVAWRVSPSLHEIK